MCLDWRSHAGFFLSWGLMPTDLDRSWWTTRSLTGRGCCTRGREWTDSVAYQLVSPAGIPHEGGSLNPTVCDVPLEKTFTMVKKLSLKIEWTSMNNGTLLPHLSCKINYKNTGFKYTPTLPSILLVITTVRWVKGISISAVKLKIPKFFNECQFLLFRPLLYVFFFNNNYMWICLLKS